WGNFTVWDRAGRAGASLDGFGRGSIITTAPTDWCATVQALRAAAPSEVSRPTLRSALRRAAADRSTRRPASGLLHRACGDERDSDHAEADCGTRRSGPHSHPRAAAQTEPPDRAPGPD